MALFPSTSAIATSFDSKNVKNTDSFWVQSPIESKGIKLYSGEYYAACTIGGILGKLFLGF